MRTLTLLASACTLLLIAGTSVAQETKSIPKHNDYMNICLEAYGPTEDKVEMAVGLALCQCSFERLPTTGRMSEAQFTSATESCLAEFHKTPKEFTVKHASKAMSLAEKE